MSMPTSMPTSSSLFQVANVEIDLFEYCSHWFFFNLQDYLVFTEYIDPRQYAVHVARLDCVHGWNIPLRTLSWFHANSDAGGDDRTQIVHIGVQLEPNQWTKRVVVTTDFDIFPSAQPIPDIHACQYHRWNALVIPPLQHITLAEFNDLFPHADLPTSSKCIPASLFVFGKRQNELYCANIRYTVEHDKRHIVNNFWNDNTYYPAMTLFKIALDESIPTFYFVMSNMDGGLFERMPWNPYRTKEQRIVASDDHRPFGLTLDNGAVQDDMFPIFHQRKYILGPSNHIQCPWLLHVPDRHYFYHNLNHSFRSFHRGMPFQDKIGRIVYAGKVINSWPNNFKYLPMNERKKSQRQFFLEDIATQPGIESWLRVGTIAREDMVEYKYILDIDGHGATWDATAWKLNSGSVLLKTDSIYCQWFHHKMVEGVHYLKVRDDFSNLQEVFHWCETHPRECQWISRNARQLFQEVYRFRHIVDDMRQLIHQFLV